MSTEFIKAVKGESKILTTNHLQAVKEESSAGRKLQDDAEDAKLEGNFNNFEVFDCRPYLRARYMGSWLTIRGTTVTGKVLSAM